MTDKPIGKIIHYYDKIGVGVIEVYEKLKVGDKIKIVGVGGELEQSVDSLQVDHKDVSSLSKGQEAGLKIDQPVKKGDLVYLVE